MCSLMSSPMNIQAEPEVVLPTSNDVIMGQLWLQQSKCFNFQYVIVRNAGAFLASQVANNSGEVVATVAVQLGLLGVRFILFDFSLQRYIRIRDDVLIAAEISAAFVQYFSFPSTFCPPSAGFAGAYENMIGQSLAATSLRTTDSLGAAATLEHGVVDLTEEDEEEVKPPPFPTDRNNVIQYKYPSNELQVKKLSEQGSHRLPSASNPRDDEHGCTSRLSEDIDTASSQQAKHTVDMRQSTGEQTGQRLDPALSPNAHAQDPENEAESQGRPDSLELSGEGSSPFPASHAITYSSSFYPMDMSDLPHKAAGDMTGWQFFPMQLTQDLKDVPLLNEWKVVVVPMGTTPGEPFTMSP
ncbi:hypothetical protein MHU86_23680 [Fragilaria crotonensis]|nr:hypothetical protein MHU86_23680 [Fragilaria crotonensis]